MNSAYFSATLLKIGSVSLGVIGIQVIAERTKGLPLGWRILAYIMSISLVVVGVIEAFEAIDRFFPGAFEAVKSATSGTRAGIADATRGTDFRSEALRYAIFAGLLGLFALVATGLFGQVLSDLTSPRAMLAAALIFAVVPGALFIFFMLGIPPRMWW